MSASSPSSERLALLSDWFSRLTEAPAEQRAARLAECAAQDSALAAELRALLAADDSAEDVIQGVLQRAAENLLEHTTPAGRVVGPYRLVRELGHGGMGAVFLAERTGGDFEQRVALKLVHPHLLSPESSRRFQVERRILAQLEHPNIARLLDGGSSPEGIAYVAMEYVDGTPLHRFCQERALPPHARLRLLLEVCSAVQYAHARFIVHRDLKPANILVTERAEVKLLDFGIAKLLARADEPAALTASALGPMTPEYASPEQVRGEPITAATDVYGLGLLLYELLTGTRAQQPGPRPSELEQAICEREPVPPRRLVPSLSGDLEAITLKALAKRPAHRYQSVAELAADLERFLEQRPVRARPPSLAYQALRFLQRNRLSAYTLLLFGALIAGGRWRECGLKEQALLEARRADAVSTFVVDLLAASDPYQSDHAVELPEMLRKGAAQLGRRFEHDAPQRARLGARFANVMVAHGRLEDAEHTLRERLADAEAVLGATHPLTLELLELLALTLRYQYRPTESLPVYLEAYERRARVDPHAFTTRLAQAEYAYAQLVSGSGTGWKEQLLRATDGLVVPPGEQGLDAGRAELFLALRHMALGESPLMQRRLERLLETQQRQLSPSHPATSRTAALLGANLLRQGYPEQAERVWRARLDAVDTPLGRAHAETIVLRSNLAVGLLSQGRYAEAEALLAEGLEAALRLQGWEELAVAILRMPRARALMALGRPEQAAEEALSSWEIWKRQGAPEYTEAVLAGAAGALALARAGSLERAQGVLDTLATLDPERMEKGPRLYLAGVRAAVALRRGDTSQRATLLTVRQQLLDYSGPASMGAREIQAELDR